MAVGCESVNIADVDQVLSERFGFGQFLPGQREVIQCLLEGRSAAAVFPTGAGKSLCYQLPALMLPGTTIVVSPLIALMKDQIDALDRRGIAAARLDSTLSFNEYRDVMDNVRSGDIKLLYVAPERFNNERFRETLQQLDVSFFAVDEAHCISEWGHNFRPDYLKLAHYARLANAGRVLALTATATPQVLEDMCRLFEIKPECAVRTGFYRPNLTLLGTPVSNERQRDEMLLERFASRPKGATIVYVTLQRTAEEVAEQLKQAGLPARAYHAGMDNEVRAEVQDWFMALEDPIVVATIAFGMGIDKANIRYVYHYNLPKSLENYSQEVGRAGRDSEPSICEMFLSMADVNVLENFVYGDTPAVDSVRQLVQHVFGQEEQFDVSLYELSRMFDIRNLVVRTLLTYLELDGYLEGGTPFYSSYRFKPLASSAEILAGFEGERREFLATVFRQAVKHKTWFSLDVDQAADQLKVPRDRIVRALDHLSDQQQLKVESAGVRLRYRRLRKPTNAGQLSDELHQRMCERERRDIGRLHQVLEWVAHDGCQVDTLSRYFGDDARQPCGHCSWCQRNGSAAELPDRPAATIDAEIWRRAETLRKKHVKVLDDPRRFALFLCGVSTPLLVKAKVTRDELFGALAHVSYPELVAAAQQKQAS